MGCFFVNTMQFFIQPNSIWVDLICKGRRPNEITTLRLTTTIPPSSVITVSRSTFTFRLHQNNTAYLFIKLIHYWRQHIKIGFQAILNDFIAKFHFYYSSFTISSGFYNSITTSHSASLYVCKSPPAIMIPTSTNPLSCDKSTLMLMQIIIPALTWPTERYPT